MSTRTYEHQNKRKKNINEHNRAAEEKEPGMLHGSTSGTPKQRRCLCIRLPSSLPQRAHSGESVLPHGTHASVNENRPQVGLAPASVTVGCVARRTGAQVCVLNFVGRAVAVDGSCEQAAVACPLGTVYPGGRPCIRIFIAKSNRICY